MRKSVLFVHPAYHYSFTLRDELRRLGWRADVYKPSRFPSQLLYADDVLGEEALGIAACSGAGLLERLARTVRRLAFFIRLALRYRHFVVYGDAEVFVVTRCGTGSASPRIGGRPFSPELAFLKGLGRKVLFFPSGCHQEVLKRDFLLHENGRLCANCLLRESGCDDTENQRIFDLVNRYHVVAIANTPMRSRSLPAKKQLRFLGLNLDLFRPDLDIPERHRLPPTTRVRILHSFVDEGRTSDTRNVKGSPFVLDAVRRLEREGHSVEYLYFNKIPSREMRFYQAQADIVVDQLIYGWWGSTAIECLGLGKPVVCYLSPALKADFLAAFPEYDSLPIVEATTDSIYEVLKRLVTDAEYRARTGRASREFAERHFDVRKNTRSLADLLLSL